MIKKVIRLAKRLTYLGLAWSRDLLLCSYSQDSVTIRPLMVDITNIDDNEILPSQVSELYLRNHFDLLGSGWRDWSALQWNNPVNLANRIYAKQLRKLISPDYIPLDWHLDIRADHRWRSDRWSRWIKAGHPAGVDIKMPWELSRMQHQVPLALMVLDKPQLRSERAGFYRDQVLDFIASNPPRFGVNWRTPMDVAIRAANWVITYSLYRAAGETFDVEFEAALSSSLLDHGRHIVEFMEWDPEWRGNHYLANQCGLAIIASVLPESPETDAWLAFATQELQIEVLRQIQPDGSVFEASTSYHRLSLEMVAYATAVVLGSFMQGGMQRLATYDDHQVKFKKTLLPAPTPLYPLPGHKDISAPFSPEYFQRLAAAACFVRDITMNDGRAPLIGDNDSGFFVRSRFNVEWISWEQSQKHYTNLKHVPAVDGISSCPLEDQRNMGYLLGIVSGLIDNSSLSNIAQEWKLETQLVQALRAGLYAKVSLPYSIPEFSDDKPNHLPEHAITLSIPLPDGVTDGIKNRAYPDFGLFIFRSPRLYLAVRCGSIGQGGFGGHAHNDQLSVQLQIDEIDIIADPGVYRYTVDPEERRAYRSVHAHFSPQVALGEPGDLTLGPWRLGDEAQAEIEYFTTHCFQGRHQGYGRTVHRRVWLEEDRLCIADWGDNGLKVQDPNLLFKKLNADGTLMPFCPAYGVQHA